MTRRTSLLGRVCSARLAGASLDELAEIMSTGASRPDGPIHIECVADRLGIGAVVAGPLEGAAGLLLRHADLPDPLILVRASDPPRRRRFSIAHEIAHLALGHLDLCRSPDKTEEAMADRLAAMLLAPPKRVRDMLRGGPPDIRDIRRVADAFEISVDAAARAYAEWHPDPVAAIIARHGRVERCYRRRDGFPQLAVSMGDAVPPGSGLFGPAERSSSLGRRGASASDWVRGSRGGRRAVTEQMLRWRSGGTLILLSFDSAANRA